MGKGNSRLQKVRPATKDIIDRLSREISSLEDKKVCSADVIDRVFSSQEIINRLRLGAMERRGR